MARVDYSEHFSILMESLTEEEQEILGNLTIHIEEGGFAGLPGRNKSSGDFPVTFKGKGRTKAENFVREHNLWHYHVGYLTYKKLNRHGDWTSEFVVHYQNISKDNIRFVHYSSHYPQFRNPLPHHLK